MRLHAALAKALTDHGVSTMFGLIGDANLYMVDRFVHDQGGRYIAAAHEAGAVLMSYGYAKRSGKLGVSTVTHGPALTNTVTALTEGVRSRTPMLLIAGDTPSADRYNLQKIDQREVIGASGAGFEQVGSPASALADLALAMRRSLHERRPVALNVPVDYMWEEIEYRQLAARTPAPQSLRPDPDALDRAVGVIASVRRPLVLIGRGVDTAARPAVLRFAERIGAPVATTLAAKGSLSGQQFALGICGTFSTEIGTETILAADCIVAFGASLNSFTTAGGSLTKDKAVVQCDADVAAIGKHLTPTAAVVGDAGAVAQAMQELIEQSAIPSTDFRSPALAERLAEIDSDGEFEDVGTDATVDIRTALKRINSAVPKQRSLVTDGGRFIGQPLKLLDVPEPAALTYAIAFGAIGLGTATAIGAAVAAPDAPVLLVAGDGGFMNGGLTEFNTAVREGLDLIAVVCNDGSYGAEHIQFRNKNMDPSLSVFQWPDLAPVAEALGGRGVTVRRTEDLAAAERAIAERDRPLLIDLKLDPDRMPQLTLPQLQR